jgi:type III restriction enzyme
MDELKIFRQTDMVLKLNTTYNPEKLDLDDWDEYLYVLCENRKYQIDAIKTAIIYMMSENYDTLEDLIKENYVKNESLKEKYSSPEKYIDNLQIKGKLFANLDVATGTGKSYIIYGIAQIMLGFGKVDRVLVLCPSLTIEDALKTKFITLASNETLRKAIPESAIIKNPRITDATVSIVKGDICVENIHAVYKNTDSSINDSLIGNGENTLVLNDESHHIFYGKYGNTESEKEIKKWKDFLINPQFSFKYILGFTGTAYNENDYFNDVIYRYSLRTAIEEKIVKNIDYVREDDSGNEDEKFQKIFKNHEDNKLRYSKIKPLSIIITKDISNAKTVYNKLISYMCLKEKHIEKNAEEKVLIVTSSKEHEKNLPLLKTVDDKDKKIEWIISVSMLTEGWDVKNVFQIIPWEDRAFNSKLLIAQVLGRGLRVPNEYQVVQPKVIVFNHDSWSKNIVNLVDEVLEIETRLRNSILTSGERCKYIFNLYNLKYKHIEKEVESEKDNNVFDFTRIEKEGIKLDSQSIVSSKTTEFTNIIDSSSIYKEYQIIKDTVAIDEVLDKLYDDFVQRDWEGKILKLSSGEYTQNTLPPMHVIKNIIKKSMKNVGIDGELVTEKNQYKILSAFNTLIRKKKKTVTSSTVLCDIYEVQIQNMDKASISIGNLKRGYTLFFTDDWKSEIVDEDSRIVMEEVLKDESWPISAIKEKNKYLFKTPFDIVFTNKEPERKFVELLCKKDNAKKINAWIKSRDKGFYGIEYSYRYGGLDSKTRGYAHDIFNPDFFISINQDGIEYVLVVETKADKDVSRENIAKYKYGITHFKDLNKKLSENGINQKYIFHFLSPCGYDEFFEYLHNGKLFEGQEKFRCDLENLLLDEK